MSGAAPLGYPPATFPLFKSNTAGTAYVTNTADSANYLQSTDTTGNVQTGSNTIVQLSNDDTNNPYKLIARAYTGISNQFVLDVSGLISGDMHKVIFTDKSAAGVPYAQKNKIEVITFTPTFDSAVQASSNSVVGSSDVSMINYARAANFINTANGGMQKDCARITIKDRVNVYDGAEMQVLLQNSVLTSGSYTQAREVKFTSNANTAPPLLINGGPGGPSDFTVTIDSSANSEVTGVAATPSTGVVSLDMGSKIYGVGIDISQVIVAYTDTTDLNLSTITLDYTKDGRSTSTYTRYKLSTATALTAALTDAKLATANAVAGTYNNSVNLTGSESGRSTAKASITLVDRIAAARGDIEEAPIAAGVTIAAARGNVAQASAKNVQEDSKISPITNLPDGNVNVSATMTTNAKKADGGAITASVQYVHASTHYVTTFSGVISTIDPDGNGDVAVSASNRTVTIQVAGTTFASGSGGGTTGNLVYKLAERDLVRVPVDDKVAPAAGHPIANIANIADMATNAKDKDGTAITASVTFTAATGGAAAKYAITFSGIVAQINPGTGDAIVSATNRTLTITAKGAYLTAGSNSTTTGNLLYKVSLAAAFRTATSVAVGSAGAGYKVNENVTLEAVKLGAGSAAISNILTVTTANGWVDDATAFTLDQNPRTNRKRLTDADIASGKISNAFEILLANNKTYEFTVAYKDAKGIIGVGYGANGAGIMSEGASPITLGTPRTGDLEPVPTKSEIATNAIAANNKVKMNGGKGKVVYLPWSKPTYIPGTLLNYKVYWLSEKDCSNSLGGSGGAGESYNFLFADAQKKGNMITVDPSLSAIVPVGENYSGSAFDFDGTKNAAAFTAIEKTDGSGNWAFWVTATVQKADGTIVDGQVNNPSIPLYTTDAALQTRSVKPRNYVQGCPSAPELWKVLGGKDVQALATGESQLANHVMENRLKVSYYDENASSGGSTIDGARFAVFRTQDVPYLPAEIADASFNAALNATIASVTKGIDFQNIESTDSATVNFVTDYYDDLSGVWRNIGLASGGHKHNIKDNTPVNKYYANNAQIQNLRDGQSYTVFMKLSNANGGGVISVGKSALVSSKPNARSFLPGDLIGLPNTDTTATNYPDVLGDYWLGSDNNNAANGNADRGRENRNDDGGAVSNIFIGRSATNPESFLQGVHMNNNNRDALAIFSNGLSAGNLIAAPAPLASGVKDSSYCTIDDKHLKLKYSLTYDLSKNIFGTQSGQAPTALRARNAASLNLPTGGKAITYLKYQVHTPNSRDNANAGANATKASARAREIDAQALNRTGFGLDGLLPWHPEYYTSTFGSNAGGKYYGERRLKDISGGTYPSAPNLAASANAISKDDAFNMGIQNTEQPQKTIQIAAPADGKVSIKHYYDASGNAQPLVNGIIYNIKLWAGNENGDSIFKDVSYANFVPRAQIAAPNAPYITAGQAISIVTVNGKKRISMPLSWQDISGYEGNGQFYQSYVLKASQNIGGVDRPLATLTQQNIPNTDGITGYTILNCANNGKTNTGTLVGTQALEATENVPVYGVPIKVTITGYKSNAADSANTAVVTTRGTTDGVFGENDKDVSGATTTRFFDMPLSANNSQNEVQDMSVVSTDKKLTVNFVGANTAALYNNFDAALEAPTQIVGYSVFLYDASLNNALDITRSAATLAGLTASTFQTDNRPVTLLASKNVAATGGEQSVEFDNLVNGHAYVPRITTTYAYGPISSRKVVTTEGAYLGKLDVATSAAPTPVGSGGVNFLLPNLTFAEDLANQCGVPAGVPIFGSKAVAAGNELTIDDNGSALIGGQMIQIIPQASTGTSAFAAALKAATYGNALTNCAYSTPFPGNKKRIVSTFNNTFLGNTWNSEINYIFAMNAKGTSVAVTNLDTATLGDNVKAL